MNDQFRRDEILDAILEMERLAENIALKSKSFPAIERNLKRIQACITMIKLNLGE